MARSQWKREEGLQWKENTPRNWWGVTGDKKHNQGLRTIEQADTSDESCTLVQSSSLPEDSRFYCTKRCMLRSNFPETIDFLLTSKPLPLSLDSLPNLPASTSRDGYWRNTSVRSPWPLVLSTTPKKECINTPWTFLFSKSNSTCLGYFDPINTKFYILKKKSGDLTYVSAK